ncbi:MAG TPA: hypothetical protein VFW60_02070 [Rhodanobacteraceae bacterium]|nr:hypothetical protein [Rhodanobacteraceae bacterium]
MNCRPAASMFALIGVLALTSVGCSQSPTPNNQQQSTQPQPNSTSQTPYAPAGTTGAPQPMGTMGAPAANGTMGQAGQTGDFDVLAGSKGFISKQDAQRDPWLANHFPQCDSNHDGRVTRQEYDQCKAGQGAMGQPNPQQMPPGASSGP